MKTTHLTVQRHKHIPKELVDGILYYSEEFALAIHLCACGCKIQTVTPINNGNESSGWWLNEDMGGPTLRPSIGNQNFPCKSHYNVVMGEIVWLA